MEGDKGIEILRVLGRLGIGDKEEVLGIKLRKYFKSTVREERSTWLKRGLVGECHNYNR